MDRLLIWSAALALCVAGALLGLTVQRTGLSSAETAAWIQAIGTIAAIVAAVWIYKGQINQQAERDAAQQRAMSDSANIMAITLLNGLRVTDRIVKADVHPEAMRDQAQYLAELVRLASGLPIWSLANTQAMQMFSNLQFSVRTCGDLLTTLIAASEIGDAQLLAEARDQVRTAVELRYSKGRESYAVMCRDLGVEELRPSFGAALDQVF